MQKRGPVRPEKAAELRALEERFLRSDTSSRESLERLLAPDYREFGASGQEQDVFATLDVLMRAGRPRVVVEKFAAAIVADGAMLLTYVSRSVAGAGWKPPAFRSSLWCVGEGRWQRVFHQCTPLADAE